MQTGEKKKPAKRTWFSQALLKPRAFTLFLSVKDLLVLDTDEILQFLGEVSKSIFEIGTCVDPIVGIFTKINEFPG
jgi:hypothetical protein